MIPINSLRLFLTFLDELKQVEVLAATNRFGPPLSIMGIVEGREQLLDFLRKVGIDHYIISSGDPLTPSFRVTAYGRSPKLIVEDLQKSFQRADELQIRILNNNRLTEEEQSFTVPTALHLCSSSMKTDEGLRRIQTWFKEKKQDKK